MPNEEESNVVFGDPNSKKKLGKRNGTPDPAQNGTVNPQGEANDGSKKPDTRKLIGGASWTGKLPVNMLSEHCQKQKWAKPEYTMVPISYPSQASRSLILRHRAKHQKAFRQWLYSKL
jgi:hypothetical protein